MKFRFWIMSLLSLFTFGCDTAPAFRSVDVDEFAQVIAQEDVVVVDVRRAEEWAAGHLPQARHNIDVLQEDFSTKAENLLPKDKTIAIYCRSGRRSKDAADRLAKCGFDVVELDGGIISWQERSMPTVK